jgi:hypothetical protein
MGLFEVIQTWKVNAKTDVEALERVCDLTDSSNWWESDDFVERGEKVTEIAGGD